MATEYRYGTNGNDLLVASDNNSYFIGYLGVDTMRGGAGNDTFRAGSVGSVAQADVIEGGAGDDLYYIDGQADAGTVTFDGGTGTDRLEVSILDGSTMIDLTGMTISGVEILKSFSTKLRMTGAQAQGFSVMDGYGQLSIVGTSDLSGVSITSNRTLSIEGNDASLTVSNDGLAFFTTITFTGTNASMVIADPGGAATSALDKYSLSGVSHVTAHGENTRLSLYASQLSQLSTITMDGAPNSKLMVYAAANGGLIDLKRTGFTGIGAGILVGRNGNDTLSGTDGNDLFYANLSTSSQSDLIYGLDGDDSYEIRANADAGTVTFDGGAGIDRLVAAAPMDMDITGMTLTSVEVLDLQVTSSRSLTMTGVQAASFTTIIGSVGTDTLTIKGSADLSAVSMTSIDIIKLSGAGATLALTATQAAALTGFSRSDPASVLQVTATQQGGTVDLSGLVFSAVAHTVIRGGAGVDTLRGGAGEDLFVSSSSPTAQSDKIYAGAGNDRYRITGQQDAGTVLFDGGAGTDTLEIATSSAISLAGMTLTGVEILDLSDNQDHAVTLTGAQAGAFSSLRGGTGVDVLTISGTSNLSARTLTGIDGIVVAGSGATLTLSDTQFAGLALTGNGNALAVKASGSGATVDVSEVSGFGRVGLTGTVGADVLTVGAGGTVTGNGGNDVIHIAAGTSGAVTISDASVGDRLVIDGADLTGMQVVTSAGSTSLRLGANLAVTLTGSFDPSQFQVGVASSVTIVQANHAPVAEAGKTVTAQVDTPTALDIAAPTDGDGDALTVTVTGLPTGGTIRLSDGTAAGINQTMTTAQLAALTFTPTAGTVGAAGSFTYIVADSRGGSAGQSVALTVNAAPVAETDKTVTAQAGASMALGIAAPSDANADALSVTVTGLPAGGTIRLSDGTAVGINQSMTTAQLAALTFTPTAGTLGAAGAFTYSVTDGRGGSAGQTVTLTVTAAPIVLPPLAPSDGSGGSATPGPVSPSIPGREPGHGGDRLIGGDGNDLLFSSRRGNTFIGKGGVDAVRLHGVAAQYEVDALDHATATTRSLADLGGVDSLQGVEILRFDDGIRLISSPTLTTTFDERAYLVLNPDVAAAVRAGASGSGAEHFARFGATEGRAPSFAVDEDFYRAQNPDVDHAIIAGQFQTATEHYLLWGNAENRAPSALFDPDWYLASNPDVANAVGRGETTAFTHYSQFGWREDRDPSMWFDTSGYEARHQDVAAAGVNPLTHFLAFGQSEGRVAPSVESGMWV